MIQLTDFEFQYPTAEEDALKGVSVSVDQGDVLGVVGPVEAGKTTLSMAIAGFIPDITGGITGGEISVAGRDPRDASDTRAAMVFEDYSSQLTQLRVVDEVVAPLVNTGMSREAAEDRARELLSDFRLEDVSEKFTWELSGGEQQRLAIAAALAVDPEVLVFDTAVDMLDPEGRADVTSLIASLKGEKTLVVTENDPDSLIGIADKLLVLDEGRDVAVDPAEELFRDAELFERVGVAPPVCLDIARDVGLDADPVTIGEFDDAYRDLTTVDSDVEIAAQDGGTVESPTANVPGTAHETDQFGQPVIDADDISFDYPDGTRAIEDVDVTVHEGEVHALIGGNGAGKSTLSKLLVGLLEPSEGTVTVAGTDTSETTARDLASDVGIALQNPDEQISRETVDEELRYGLENTRYEKRGPFGLLGKRERFDDDYIEERVARVRDLVGFEEEDREKDPAFLPQGQRRLVTIAAALAPDPAALVLDEPAAGVDSTAQGTIIDAIETLAEQEIGVVIIDHDMDFVCEVADRVTVLNDGEVVMQGPVDAVFRRENWDWLSEHYMQPPRVARLADRLGLRALTDDQLLERLPDKMEVAE